MSTYYEYQDVGVMISHKLMNMEGWKVYGYHADESDGMSDYYSPAYWNGIAEKNGYILCFNVYDEAKPQEIRQYSHDGKMQDMSISEKIQKLKQMTIERGASEAEAETARNMINKLENKQTEATEKYIVIGIIPGHLANPPRCNWHIEKDGVIIAKGNGLLKYAHIDDYYRYDRGFKELDAWKKDEEQYIKDCVINNMNRWNDTEERAKKSALSHIEELEKDDALISQFEAFINKLDTTCGGLITEVTEETTTDIDNLTFEVSEDTDTRTNAKIYLVKVAEKLSREDYVKVNKYIKSIGGYYSKFKHAFLFKENPTGLLNATPTEAKTEETPLKTT